MAQASAQSQQALLADQHLNFYSYGADNPLSNKDPNGNFSIGFSYNGSLEGGFGLYSATNLSTNVTLVVDPKTRQAWILQSNLGARNSGIVPERP